MLIHPCRTGFKRGVSLLSAVVVSGRSEKAVLMRSTQTSLIEDSIFSVRVSENRVKWTNTSRTEYSIDDVRVPKHASVYL